MGDTAERQTTAARPQAADSSGGAEVARSRRIRLRQLCFADIPWLSRLYAPNELQHLQLDESPTRFFEVAALVASAHQIYEKHRGLGVWRADAIDGEFIGIFSLTPRDATGEMEIRARLAPEAWGHWYAIEGGRLLCRYAFVALGLPALAAYCHPGHEVVAHILTRIGFCDTGLCDYDGKTARRFELEAARWSAAQATLRAY
jgi:RimJ/RimL family protein N-acetyltransferase